MNHEFYMQRCLELAAKGAGNTLPNPLVGCVIVHQDSIVAEGFHQVYGGPHAEVNAINNLKDRSILPDCTLYVNLEPCSHYGKTPPCAELLVLIGVQKVVVAAQDPNLLVAGQGIQKLRDAGIEVILGICQEEAIQLNKVFYHVHLHQRPYVTLKWAQTQDGFIGKNKTDIDFETKKNISGNQSQIFAHQLRANCDAILIGGETARNDNPSLTTRRWPGKNPMRVVVSKSLNLSPELLLFKEEAPTIIFTEQLPALHSFQVPIYAINFEGDIAGQILEVLYTDYMVQHLLVEGGTQIIETFYHSGHFNEIVTITNKNKFYKQGVKAPSIKEEFTLINEWDDDMIHQYIK
ncbi:MAG: bifunctional diaminohydroxyphosphoribosylaminopyrimidine deaminase/5-amino-6-(5-phosphoribosylamino)uracil reductase RibD [Bacteroidetes bacterium]|nr:bifunctional diaminohydroxyphosphoribosylaminopyrimidine deaminase/5-amino-6-(5-phosphoribosylamino)uracil reductase RibD [Bacteroidota bacterium]